MTLTWDGEHYADHTAHHRQYDNVVRERLHGISRTSRILDVGCGVGDFTAGLVELVPQGTVSGVDADPSMIAVARERHGDRGISFEVCRAQDLSSLPGSSVDVLVSTACLHWLPRLDHPAFLAGAAHVLTADGRMVLEFGGAGQLEQVRGVLDPLATALGGRPPTWWFASDQEYRLLLDDAGIFVARASLVRQVRAMADAAALRGWLTSQVLVGYRPHLPEHAWDVFVEGACAGVEELVRQEDGSCDVEYVRLIVEAAVAR